MDSLDRKKQEEILSYIDKMLPSQRIKLKSFWENAITHVENGHKFQIVINTYMMFFSETDHVAAEKAISTIPKFKDISKDHEKTRNFFHQLEDPFTYIYLILSMNHPTKGLSEWKASVEEYFRKN